MSRIGSGRSRRVLTCEQLFRGLASYGDSKCHGQWQIEPQQPLEHQRCANSRVKVDEQAFTRGSVSHSFKLFRFVLTRVSLTRALSHPSTTPNTSTPAVSNQQTLQTAAIAVGVWGGVSVAATPIIILWLVRRRYYQRQHDREKSESLASA